MFPRDLALFFLSFIDSPTDETRAAVVAFAIILWLLSCIGIAGLSTLILTWRK